MNPGGALHHQALPSAALPSSEASSCREASSPAAGTARRRPAHALRRESTSGRAAHARARRRSAHTRARRVQIPRPARSNGCNSFEQTSMSATISTWQRCPGSAHGGGPAPGGGLPRRAAACTSFFSPIAAMKLLCTRPALGFVRELTVLHLAEHLEWQRRRRASGGRCVDDALQLAPPSGWPSR